MRLRSVLFLFVALAAARLRAQSPLAAEATPAFDVASVHQRAASGPAVAGATRSNVPLGPGDIYSPSGGVLTIRSVSLVTLISFAFRLPDAQLADLRAHVPEWVLTDRFDVEARTDDPNVSKNTLRLMVQRLLADRFRLLVHHEERQSNIFALSLMKPGVLGPRLRLHPETEGCSTAIPDPKPGSSAADALEVTPGGYPTVCGGLVQLDGAAPGQILIGGRAVPMQLLVNSLASWGQLDRPILDRTQLAGKVDFLLQYAPRSSPDALNTPEGGGPDFTEALKRQLGLKLRTEKARVEFLVLDHVQHPTPN